MSDGPKNIMYINRRPPHGTIYAVESLEVVLIGAAFDQAVSLAFLDDGVFQLENTVIQKRERYRLVERGADQYNLQRFNGIDSAVWWTSIDVHDVFWSVGHQFGPRLSAEGDQLVTFGG